MSKKVLITRAKNQAADFAKMLEEMGFDAVILPVIEFAPPRDKASLSEAMVKLETYDWLILTSVNSVKYFMQALHSENKTESDLHSMKLCAVGPKTAEAATNEGLKVALIPETFQAEGVIEALKKMGIEGRNILFPRAEEGRDILPEGLRLVGAKVDLVPVYRITQPEGIKEAFAAIMRDGLDIITFTSGSTVKNFMDIVGNDNRDALKDVKIACLSNVTSSVADKDYGLKTDILPKENTTSSLAKAIEEHFAKCSSI